MNTVNQHKVILTNMTLSPHQSMSFYGILPDDVTESHSANFENIDIQSRSGQLFSYSGGESRSISINIDVHEDYLAEYEGGTADIREFVARFKAITYPEYEGTHVIPPEILLRVGSFIYFHGICRSTNVTWHKPIRNDRYIYATLTMDLTETNSNAFAASEIMNMDDLRRI